MSSIVTAVFKATIGLLVNKSRDKAAEKLRDGDVTDHEIRCLIVREIHDIKLKLDGLARKDLLASISFFKEGIELLYVVFDKARSRSENGAATTQAAEAACAEAFSLAKGMRNLELTDLDESATRALSKAKKRFEDARREATRAFRNEALDTGDRILAMQYRVMATILETVDHPANAVATCRVCIEELNSLPAVQNSFNVQLKKGIQAVTGLFSRDERRKIISSVCHLNRVIYDVTQALGEDEPFWMWPAVDTGKSGEGKVDPLRDGRLTEVLCRQDMEHCCVMPWLLGQEGEEEHKMKKPIGIAINLRGQFIVADLGDGSSAGKVKFFGSSGKFMDYFSLPSVYPEIIDVASDLDDKIYVLTKLNYEDESQYNVYVYEFNCTADFHRKLVYSRFTLRETPWYRWNGIAVDDSRKVFITGRATCVGNDVVEVHKADGQDVPFCEEGLLKNPVDITAASNGRVMVVDAYDNHGYVNIFSEQGSQLNKFKLIRCCSDRPRIAFERASEHIVVADVEDVGKGKGLVHIQVYTNDGKFVRSTQIPFDIHGPANLYIDDLKGIAVTTEGHIAVVIQVNYDECKVLVV